MLASLGQERALSNPWVAEHIAGYVANRLCRNLIAKLGTRGLVPSSLFDALAVGQVL